MGGVFRADPCWPIHIAWIGRVTPIKYQVIALSIATDHKPIAYQWGISHLKASHLYGINLFGNGVWALQTVVLQNFNSPWITCPVLL